MAKKFIIKESQYLQLVERKKAKKVSDTILESIERKRKSINEQAVLNEAVIDTLRKAFKKGLLTTIVLANLLAGGVTAQELKSAGIEDTKIEQAAEDAMKRDDNFMKKVEKKFIQQLEKTNKNDVLQAYSKLSEDGKVKVLSMIADNIDNPNEIKNIDFSLLLNRAMEIDKETAVEIGQRQISKPVQVGSTTFTLDFQQNFKPNEYGIENPEAVKDKLQNVLDTMQTVNSIRIVASSDAYRNTGEEPMTWLELTRNRAEAIENIIVGMEYDLGGCGANEKKTISPSQVQLEYNGENGDGTSGPPSPNEVNPEIVAWYQEQGIDNKYWDSAAEGTPLENKEDYSQFRYVKIYINGDVVITDTEEIVNFDYIVMNKDAFGIDGDIPTPSPKGGKYRPNTCPLN